MSAEIEVLCYDLLTSFVKILELRNPFNIDHCKLVAHYCDKLANEVKLPEADRLRLVRAAEIHTLGVLLQMEEKQAERDLPISGLGDQTGREVSIHQREDEIFENILCKLPQLSGCQEILKQRHEWFDGTGSILGLSGENICREARIMAVADAYVDLATPKAHRPPEAPDVAISRLKELSGLQFDPQYVAALERALDSDEVSSSDARARKFELAHCRHYLGLGHFYTQIHETDWALRSYVAAERMAERMGEPGLALGAISGRFMVFCDLDQLERAREVLNEVRSRGISDGDKLGYQLLWGLLEWLHNNPTGKDILDRVILKHQENQNLPGLAAALAFQACMTLFQKGGEDPEHLAYLGDFLEMVDSHDVFDVVERYRPYTIPVFLNAVVRGVKSQLARNLLTRMGEPCHGPLHEKLRDIEPSQWTKALMPETTLGRKIEVQPQSTVGAADTIRIETLGLLKFHYEKQTIGIEHWQTQKTLKLFLRAALNSGLPLSNETLAEELWPEAGLKKGTDSLRNCVHQLRKTLKALLNDEQREIVSRSRKNKTMTLEVPCRFDFQDFEEACLNALEALKSEKTEEALKAGSNALSLYRGPFLEGMDEAWIEAKRARLAALYAQAQTVVTRAYLGQQDYEKAAMSAAELIKLDDLREDSHLLRIEALCKGGRSAEAVTHYETAVDLFEEEIGVRPESLTVLMVELGLIL